MLTLKPALYLLPAVALLLLCLAAANAEARGGSHGSGMRSLGHPAGASATPMPGRSEAGAPVSGTGRANALVNPAAAAAVTAPTPAASAALPSASASGSTNPTADAAATAAAAVPAASAATTAPVAGPASPAPAEPALPALAPMSDPLPTQFATGGGSSPNLALSPATSASSPSESTPSSPGGGGKSLKDCMGFWDAATHMTKPEWRAACKRSMAEFPDVKW